MVQYLKELINLFHKDYYNKQTAIWKIIDIVKLMPKSTIKLTIMVTKSK